MLQFITGMSSLTYCGGYTVMYLDSMFRFAVVFYYTLLCCRGHPDYASYFAKSLETFLILCNDADSNVRMVADNSLNRVIKASPV